jgi:hypothetical protein
MPPVPCGHSTNAEREHAILLRMLLRQGAGRWENHEPALLSILASRVQMGQTSASVVSTLVRLGYASLTYFQKSNERAEEMDALDTADFFAISPIPCVPASPCASWMKAGYPR